MISHRNCITNVSQIILHEQPFRAGGAPDGGPRQDVGLGLLPQSHIYGLVVISLGATSRGDTVIILPKFEMTSYLTVIAKYKINTLYVVPPIIIAMVNNPQVLAKYDLSSVRAIFTGAAPLGASTAKEVVNQYPSWLIRQG